VALKLSVKEHVQTHRFFTALARHLKHHVMAKVVNHRPLTAEARLAPRSVHVGFVVCKMARTGFSQSSSLSLVSTIPALCSMLTYIIWGMNNRPIGGCSSETLSRTIYYNNNKMFKL
jgi:hypothetical protein